VEVDVMGQKIEGMVAGLGGQGLLTTGRLLAEAAMPRYKHVLYFPNYGPQMRGGESECTVILSDEEIASKFQISKEGKSGMMKRMRFGLMGNSSRAKSIILDTHLSL